MAWPTSQPIFAIKFALPLHWHGRCFGGVAQNLGNQKRSQFMKFLIAKQSKSKGEPQRDNLKYI